MILAGSSNKTQAIGLKNNNNDAPHKKNAIQFHLNTYGLLYIWSGSEAVPLEPISIFMSSGFVDWFSHSGSLEVRCRVAEIFTLSFHLCPSFSLLTDLGSKSV